MKYPIIPFLCLVLLLLLGACSNLEDKGQARYDEAIQLEKAGEVERAKGLYLQLIEEFPETNAADMATVQLEKIETRRTDLLRKELFAILESMQTIVVGYQGMVGRFPQGMADFDEGTYFFDSDYMLELLPADVTAWVALPGEPGAYRVWVQRAGADVAYWIGQGSTGVRQIKQAQLQNELQEKFTVTERKQNLWFVTPTFALETL